MTIQNIDEILQSQRAYFESGATLPVKFRIENLKRLRETVKKYEKEICAALTADLGKSEFEGFMCEVGLVLSELTYMIKHTRKFAKARKVRTPLAQFASKSYKKPSPYGTILSCSLSIP